MRTLLTALIALVSGLSFAAAPTKIDALQLGGDADAGGHAITNASSLSTTGGVVATLSQATNIATGVTNSLGTAGRATLGQSGGNVPQWFEAVSGNGGEIVLYTDDVGGGLYLSSRTINDVVLSRAGARWPRTFLASGLNYYDYGVSAGGGSLCSISSGTAAFPQGMYTNVARIAVHIRWSQNPTLTGQYGTNFTLRITGAGPTGPAGGAWVLWNQACDWIPTNSGTWVFSAAGGTGTASTTGTVVNKTAPVYDTYSAVHLPFIYLINNGPNPVTNATCSYVIEYDNGAAD